MAQVRSVQCVRAEEIGRAVFVGGGNGGGGGVQTSRRQVRNVRLQSRCMNESLDRVGKSAFKPQTRIGEFHPSALDDGFCLVQCGARTNLRRTGTKKQLAHVLK